MLCGNDKKNWIPAFAGMTTKILNMIARLEGKLVKLDTESALVQVGAVGYEVLLPGYCISALASSIGSNITLCAMNAWTEEATR